MKIYHWAAGLALLSGVILENSLGDETAVVTQKNVNVRGQPSLYSEVITHLKQGDTVTVLEEIKPEKPKPGDPDKWARIKLPEDTHVWVFGPYVKDNAISVTKLNLRGGPGENFSVLGRMQKGENVKPIRTLQDWIEIEAPTNASAYIAFEVLKRIETAPVETPAPSVEPATPAKTTPLPPLAVETKTATEVVPKPVETISNPAPSEKSALKQVETTPAEPSVTNVVNQTTVKTTNSPAPVLESKPALTENAPIQPDSPKTSVSQLETKAVSTPDPVQPKSLAPKTVVDDAAPVLPKDGSQIADRPTVETPKIIETKPVAAPVSAPILVAANSAPAPAAPELKPKEITEIPPASKPAEEPLIKRIVRREGIVRNALSIQAPTPFELVNPETHKSMDYLHGEKSGVTVKHFKGQRVIVTGEEGIDPRWPNTPVLEIETIDSAP